MVERKGLGHPDSICDAIAEHVCVRLCRHYLERFGVILHHNVDKVLLCGGASRAELGGGEVLEPIEIYLAGRATAECRGESIPVHDIARDACREWVERHLPALDIDRHLRVVSRLRPGSADLTHLFDRKPSIPLANDTSCGVGFAPPTDLERVVLAVERRLNASETKALHPEIGSDIKVMGVRRGRRIELTIGCAFIGRFVRDMSDYEAKKGKALMLALEAARAESALEIEAAVNVADDLQSGSVFLTVLGTSAEAGDDGQVGRGNRANGLIAPYRPMTLEATAGKNPVTHVGKLYNLVAPRIAAAIVAQLPEVKDATCVLVSRIGYPVSDPYLIDIGLAREARSGAKEVILDIAHAELARIPELRSELLAETLPVC